MNKIIVMGIVVGLIVGLVAGVFIGAFFISPSKSVAGKNNQVEVSGNVPNKTSGTLYFSNLNGTFQTSTSVTNSEYSVLLLGGQSYAVSVMSGGGNTIDGQFYPYMNYNVFYVPLGVSTFTENLVHNS